MIFKRAAIWSRVSRAWRNPVRAIVPRESVEILLFGDLPIITDGLAKRGEEKGGKMEERKGKEREGREKKSRDRDRSCARVDTLARFITIRSDEAWPGKAERAGA